MNKPYYTNELVTIYNADCMDVLPELEPVDLVLTDPPYGIGEDGKSNHTRCNLAVSTYFDIGIRWDKKRIEKIKDVVNCGKNAIVWGGNYYADILGASNCWIVWDKDNGKTDFADCELAWTSFKTAVRKIKWRWQGMLQEDMKNKETRMHPTQKPVPLFVWILKNYSEQNHTILDPFLGSGTTAVAAMQLNRQCIGIELEEKYCEIAAKRCEQFKTGLTFEEQEEGQQTLFEESN